MRLSILSFAAVVVASSVCVGSATAAAPLLAVDFGHNPPGTPVQPGFSDMAGPTSQSSASAPFGIYTVTVAGDGFYNAGFNAGNVAPPVAPLFEDYYYNNSTTNGVGVTLSIAGVTPNTAYDVTLWSYDEDNIFSPTPTLWAGIGTTSGTSGSITNFASPYPSTLAEYSTTIRVQSTTGTLDIFGTTTEGGGGTRLNGFEMRAVPEPSTVVLAVIGAMAVGFYRRSVRRRSRADAMAV